MKISLLARPFSSILRVAKNIERNFNYVKYTLRGNTYKAWTCTFPIGGHQDIVDSFIKGAKYFPEVQILVNPSRKDAEGSIVYVPSGWKALRDAISLKRQGKIFKLITGSVGEYIHDYNDIILDKAIDVCIVPCEWYKEKYEKEAKDNSLAFLNIKVWPVGVDCELWSPQRTEVGLSKALLYVKGSGALVSESAKEVLVQQGGACRTLICGQHTPSDYKLLLEWCDFVVYCGQSETQGLAIAQAWAMNRPTFVYEQTSLALQGISAAPYLTEYTGKKWCNATELRECLRCVNVFSPREWVLAHQTNRIAFGNFLKIVNEL